jgi:tetratricopeptide (TPR) repeat protein
MSLPRLYLSQSANLDLLEALEFGRVADGTPPEHWHAVGEDEDFGYLHDGEGGPIVGFQVSRYSTFDPESPSVAEIWTAAHFEVPLLGLVRANAGEIILAARALLGTADTLNREYFEAAMSAVGDPRESLQRWLQCLQAGDSMAHHALGYTLLDLGRHHEAYRHLRYYVGIAPAGAWNWAWLGRAAAAIGETEEARDAFERAILLDKDNETDAREQLAALTSDGGI